MSHESNSHLRKLDETQAARKQFDESEWRLYFLRTQSAEPAPQPKDEALCKTFTPTTEQLWS